MSDERRRARERAAATGDLAAAAALAAEECRVGRHDFPDGLLHIRSWNESKPDGWHLFREVTRACRGCAHTEVVESEHQHDRTVWPTITYQASGHFDEPGFPGERVRPSTIRLRA